jgi:hypothetical protein
MGNPNKLKIISGNPFEVSSKNRSKGLGIYKLYSI